MKHTFFLFIVFILLLFNCRQVEPEANANSEKESGLVGEWDNFQQVWLENTADDIHRIETVQKHGHYHMSISADESDKNMFEIQISEGRNGKNFVEKISIAKKDIGKEIRIDGDTLFVSGMKHFENPVPYKFIRARLFDGWLQYPVKQYKDSTYFLRDLKIHDQGGMAEVNVDGIYYTVELTQLVYGNIIKIMKIAIYDMPLDSVEINSRSISYAWTTPEAKRLGINLRKIASGWTFIEPGYINNTTLNRQKKQ